REAKRSRWAPAGPRKYREPGAWPRILTATVTLDKPPFESGPSQVLGNTLGMAQSRFPSDGLSRKQRANPAWLGSEPQPTYAFRRVLSTEQPRATSSKRDRGRGHPWRLG